jgi:hypothetical protein
MGMQIQDSQRIAYLPDRNDRGIDSDALALIIISNFVMTSFEDKILMFDESISFAFGQCINYCQLAIQIFCRDDNGIWEN